VQHSTNKITSILKIGSLSNIAINPNTNTIYVLASNSTYVLDGNTRAVLSRIPINVTSDNSPRDIAIDQDTNRIYVTYSHDPFANSNTSDWIYEIGGNTNTVISHLKLANYSGGIAVDKEVYLIEQYRDIVAITPSSESPKVGMDMDRRINIGLDLSNQIVSNPVVGMLYAPNGLNSSISVIDVYTDSVIGNTPTVNYPTSLSFNPNTNML
jgi:DNA-binding beta-propeller fold protein YncE